MLIPFLASMAKFNPVACVLECVVPFRSTASMAIIRNQLRDLGYTCHETVLEANDWNLLEHRVRFCLVAVTNGIEFSFEGLKKPEPATHTFGEIMDEVDPEHSTWGRIDYLFTKLERDKAAGKGFAPTIVDANSTRLPVLNKSLHKRQSTGTFIEHPSKTGYFRIPTVAEHSRAKGQPEFMVVGTTQTFGHETLGQAISGPPFVAVFEQLAQCLMAFGKEASVIQQSVNLSLATAA